MPPKTNSEGNTYEARWQKSGASYVAWLALRPRQKVTGATEEELVEQLWEIAVDAFGDGEACIELVPPLPVPGSTAGYFDPPWFRFTSNEGLHQVGETAELYRDGLCPFCHTGLGGRNDTARIVDRNLRGDLGFVWSASSHVTVVSESFVRFFRPLLGSSMRTAPCRAERRSRKLMWELELTGGIPLACHKHGTHAGGDVCPKCGTMRFGFFVYEPIQKGLTYAIARSEADALTSTVAIVRTGDSGKIIVRESLAHRIKKSLKGVMLDRLAILPAAEVGRFKISKRKKSDVR